MKVSDHVVFNGNTESFNFYQRFKQLVNINVLFLTSLTDAPEYAVLVAKAREWYFDVTLPSLSVYDSKGNLKSRVSVDLKYFGWYSVGVTVKNTQIIYSDLLLIIIVT